MASTEFRRASQVLKGIEWAEQVYEDELEQLVETDEDRRVLRNKKHREERGLLLDQLVPERKCPGCERVRPDTKDWVVSRNQRFAVCRACKDSLSRRSKDMKSIPEVVFPEVQYYVTINGTALRQAREATGLTRTHFARQCGWSHTYMNKMEDGDILTVGLTKAHKILQVLKQYKVSTEDILPELPKAGKSARM